MTHLDDGSLFETSKICQHFTQGRTKTNLFTGGWCTLYKRFVTDRINSFDNNSKRIFNQLTDNSRFFDIHSVVPTRFAKMGMVSYPLSLARP